MFATATERTVVTPSTSYDNLMSLLRRSRVDINQWTAKTKLALFREVRSQHSELVITTSGLVRTVELVEVHVSCGMRQLKNAEAGSHDKPTVVLKIPKYNSKEDFIFDWLKRMQMSIETYYCCHKESWEKVVKTNVFPNLETKFVFHCYEITLYASQFKPEGYRVGNQYLVWY